MAEYFYTERLYEASYLEGVHDKTCTKIEDDPQRSGRYIFHFEGSRKWTVKLVMAFGASESCRYDDSVKRFKNRLAERIRGARRYG